MGEFTGCPCEFWRLRSIDERVEKLRQRLYINTYETEAAALAREYRLGLELNDYLWPMPEHQLHQTYARVSETVKGVDRLIMHGTIPSPDLDVLAALELHKVRAIYENACTHARFHNIDQIVFHSGFVPGKHNPILWLRQSVAFWNTFLADKPSDLIIYVENMVDDDPKLLKVLCDEVADNRLKLCLDVGHAHCHSPYTVSTWIEVLGDRIRHMHLHNNDRQRDRHWPLEKGSLDMNTVLRAVSQHAPYTTFTLECDFMPSLEWLLSFFRP